MNTIDKFIQVRPADVSIAYAFFQRYEGVLSLRAPEPQENKGTITLHLMISPSLKKEAAAILSTLRQTIWFMENPYGHPGAA